MRRAVEGGMSRDCGGTSRWDEPVGGVWEGSCRRSV